MIWRGVTAFLGGFTVLNLAGELLVGGFDANVWWIDLRPVPPAVGTPFLVLLGASLVALATLPRMTPRVRYSCGGVLLLAALIAMANVIGFYHLALSGRIHSGFAVPISLLIVATLGWIAWQTLRPSPMAVSGRRTVIGFLASAVVFPVAQVICFGSTDYRRPADAIVVFGARAYADGSPSQALADRVRTSCQLYRQGYAKTLIFSGGPGDGPVSEPQAMRRQALSLGVPDTAIRLDEAGLSTAATVRNTVPVLRAMHAKRVLAVSHGYHLPRVKIAFRRGGYDVYTVPAIETRRLRAEPFLALREVPALWLYYAEALFQAGETSS